MPNKVVVDVVIVVVLIGGNDGDVGDKSFFLSILLSLSGLLSGAISAYLLASFRNLSANDNEFALSMSNNERLLISLVLATLILLFLSSSVTGNVAFELSFVDDAWSDAIADDFWLLLSTVVLWKLKLVWTFVVGDVFPNNISESVFFVAAGSGLDGTLIVTAAAANGGGCVCGNGGGAMVNDVTLSSSNRFDVEFWLLFEGVIIVYDAVIWFDDEFGEIIVVVLAVVAGAVVVVAVVAFELSSSNA